MADRARPGASAARYGFTERGAQEALRTTGWWNDVGPDPEAGDVLAALARTPDPNLALLTVERIRNADESAWPELDAALRTDFRLRARLLSVLGYSTVLGDLVVSDPGWWHRLAVPTLTPVREYDARLADAVTTDDGTVLTGTAAVRALRATYRGLLLEIAASDLAHVVEPKLEEVPLGEITGALTALAEAALRTGLLVAEHEVGHSADATLAVIAMGKCGARELNYVSDVDVVFVGEGDIGIATRLASTLMRVVSQACFEVDAALRPEGKTGALVRSLESHEAYYTRWARTWEFQALLKARPVAGDVELGRRYAELVAPMVWSAAEREDFVADVQRMRRRVERHVPADLADRELKLGRGGLRDVEFAVQLLQLVHGRADTTLRSPSTVDALEALGAGGYVGRADAAELRESYEFLRTVEHRLQLRGLRRTHLFPEFDDVEQLRWLARASGVRPSRGRAESEVLTAEFRRHARRVRRLHEKLFYRPLLEAVSKVPTAALRLTTQQAASRLAALGYLAPDGALRHIRALTAGGVEEGSDPADAVARAAGSVRGHPRSGRWSAGVPARVRSVGRNPVVPQGVAGRGGRRRAARHVAGNLQTGAGPVGTCSRGVATAGGSRRARGAGPRGSGTVVACRGGQAAGHGGHRGGGAFTAPARVAAGGVCRPARTARRQLGLRRVVVHLDGGVASGVGRRPAEEGRGSGR